MLRPGDEPIPGYQLERFLGKGQFGQVWQSSSPGKTSLALKFLNLGGKEGWREFRSIQQIKGVRHAHLMPITALWLLDDQGRVLDDDLMASIASTSQASPSETLVVEPRSGRDSDPAWLVVAQLLGEKTLADRLKEHSDQGHTGIPADELLTYMEEAAKGIDFLNSPQHDLGAGKVALQHCDIKPANILLMGGSVLICDFGVTRTLAGQGLSATATSMVGSPAYMAPECIERRPSNASDQYSLAVTYYELRTGELPFATLEYLDVLEAHKRGRLDFSKVPATERKVLQRATSVQPKDRYGSAAEMVTALRQAVAGLPAPKRGRGFVWAAEALVVAAASLLSIALYIHWNRPSEGQLNQNASVTLTAPEWQLSVVPLDAEVRFNGELQTVGSDGVYHAPLGKSNVEVTVSRTPEYLGRTESFTIEQLQQEAHRTIALAGNASHFIAEADRLRAEGLFDAAVNSYVRAVQIDSKLAAFPATQWLLQPQSNLGVIRCLAVGEQGTRIAAGGDAQFIRCWSPNVSSDGWSSQDFARHGGRVFGLMMTDQYLVSSDYGYHVLGHQLGNATLDTAFDLSHHGMPVTRTSPDGRWLVIASPKSDENASVVAAWDLQQTPTADNGIILAEHELSVTGLVISDDSQTVVSASLDGTSQISALPPAATGSVTVADWGGSRVEFYAVCLSPQRIYLAARFEPTPDDELVNCLVEVSLDGSQAIPFPTGHAAGIETVAVSSSGRWIASGCEDGFVQLWQAKSPGDAPTNIPLPDGHRGRVAGVVFDVAEQWMVSGGDDGRVLLWDLREQHRSVALLGGHAGTVTSVCRLADGRVVTAGDDGAVRIWDIPRSMLIKSACETFGRPPSPSDSSPQGREF